MTGVIKTFIQDRLDRWIFGIALLLFLAASYLILDDRILFRGAGNAGLGEAIATLYRKDNDVRRRLETDVAFMPIANSEPVFAGDAVFTGTRSEADVVFNDGSKVTIEAGSLVVVQMTNDAAKLNIEKGALTGKLSGNKALAIVAGGQTSTLTGKDAQVQINVDGKNGTQMAVLSGNAELKSGDQKIELKANQSTQVLAGGAIAKPVTFGLELLNPRPDESIWKEGDKPIVFQWATREALKDAEYKIEVSKERDFKKIEFEKTTSKTELEVGSLPAEGSFYWRITAYESSKEVARSLSQKILLNEDHAPKVLTPADDAEVTYAQNVNSEVGQGTEVAFKWTTFKDSEPRAAKYRIEIYRDRKDALFTQSETVEMEWKSPKLSAGKYYWRVKAQDKARPHSAFSEMRTFQVSEKAPGAPMALLPESGQKHLKKSKGSVVHFEWKSDGFAASQYLLEVSKDKSFEKSADLVFSKRVESTTVEQEVADLGDYFWRVRGIASDGSMSAFSKPNKFVIAPWEALEAPTASEQTIELFLGAEGPYMAEPQKIKWSKNDAAQKYEVEIADQPDFKNPLVKETSPTPMLPWPSQLLPEASKSAYFRVRTQVTAEDFTGWSNPVLVKIEIEKEGLKAPKGIAPRGSQTLEINPKKPHPLSFEWAPAKGAKDYDFEIAKDNKFKEIVHQGRVKGTATQWTTNDAGYLYWRVRARNAYTESEWSDNNKFELEIAAEAVDLPAPILVAPVGRYFQEDDDRVHFKWEEVEGARTYEVILIRKKGTGSRLPANVIEPPSVLRYRVDNSSVRLEVPKDGSYTWKVRAMATDGKIGLMPVNEARELASLPPTPVPANAPPVTGEKGGFSTANFDLVRNPIDTKRPGYLAASTMMAPYSYQFNSPTFNGSGTAASTAITVQASGEYWFKPRWAIGGYVESTLFNIETEFFVRSAFQAVAKYRIPIAPEKGLHIAPFLGAETRQFFQIVPVSASAFSVSQFWTLGPVAGFDVKKSFTENLSASFKAQYFLPTTLMGSAVNGARITSDASYRNLSLGLQGFYWWSSRWGVGAGAFIDNRSISFNLPNGQTRPEQIITDGSYFYGSVMYRFGQ
ncbi:MAG: FecR domain-containing protein [Bdellovibrionales bacterium]|nr:FecR domain-containing protein [Bdellovibrionales bacterium]